MIEKPLYLALSYSDSSASTKMAEKQPAHSRALGINLQNFQIYSFKLESIQQIKSSWGDTTNKKQEDKQQDIPIQTDPLDEDVEIKDLGWIKF